jgi:hypothetical protein
MAPPPAVDWWADPRLRTQLMMWVPPVLLVLKSRFHINLSTDQGDGVVELALLAVSMTGGLLAFIKRIKDGKNPADPTPEVKTPDIVTAAQRLTR